MLINEQTKIAALLKHHPDALETIVTLSPDFKKLRNPVLRKLMAGRTSIAMASKIGGCRPEDFFKALAPLGFEADSSPAASGENTAKKEKPEYLQHIAPERLVYLDVRAMLAEGNDPLKYIQQKVKSLNPGEVLVIINSFEPVPLIKLLEKQGFQAFVDGRDADTVETYFYKPDGANVSQEVVLPGEEVQVPGDWENLLKHFENKRVEIDVRHLEMPGPMMTILENLETLPEGKALYVYHKRIPVFLLTELKDRDFEYRIKEVRDGEVYLLIFRNK
ncbi:DUF2249 domain-containing protein [Leadbetterella sp. DM7]|uniref:DUF2249 domain-containing protein n=1 Tax=Leadbetterella sp. DM7 TaxID=3235085 RepID=UPI00349E8FE0